MLRPLCARWAYGSGTDAHPERARQELMHSAHPEHSHQFLTRMLSMSISFPIFLMFILYTLSMRVRNWCVHWACASGTDVYAEHMSQELVRALSIRIRYTNACTERIPFKKCWAYAWGTDAYPEHTVQELMRSLSIRVRNWCVSWAYASVSYTYSKFERGSSKPCWAYT